MNQTEKVLKYLKAPGGHGLEMTLVLSQESTDQLNAVRRSYSHLIAPSKAIYPKRHHFVLFNQMPSHGINLYLKTAKRISQATQPFTLGRGVPYIEVMRGLYAVNLYMNQPKVHLIHRTMIGQWRGKVDMLETAVANWKLKRQMLLALRLSEEEAERVAHFPSNKFPTGIDLGVVNELALYEMTPSSSYPHILDHAGFKSRGRKLLKRFPLKNLPAHEASQKQPEALLKVINEHDLYGG